VVFRVARPVWQSPVSLSVASAFFGIVALEASGSADAVNPVLADWDVTSVRTDAAAAAVWKGSVDVR